MKETYVRTVGNNYSLINLIAELTKIMQGGHVLFDLEVSDSGYIDPDTEEWIPHLEYRIVGKRK